MITRRRLIKLLGLLALPFSAQAEPARPQRAMVTITLRQGQYPPQRGDEFDFIDPATEAMFGAWVVEGTYTKWDVGVTRATVYLARPE